jgi:two-component system CheB/CheR fusion protein
MLSKVFDLFTQADRAIDRAQGGLGIGLTLVRRLVELHGGRVEAFSEGPGRGSEFVIRLAVAEEAAPERADVPAVPAGPRPGRVLVVDDNVDAADSLCLLLEVTGHTTRQAHDGPSAIELATSFQPDVVLLDIGLPGLDGYEVARRMRRQAVTAGSLIVAISGYGQQEDRVKAREAGFDHHLTKPVVFGDLQAILAQGDRPSRPE